MIVLTVQSFNGAPAEPLSASFDELGGTIGRSDNNQLVLPDPERSISRIHAQVMFRNGSYAIRDRGSNPIIVNGQPLGNGREAPLRDGDRLQIGGYLLVASVGQKAMSSDPFADLFGSGTTVGPAPPPVAAARRPVPAPPPHEPPARPATAQGSPKGIPDDWDPFAPEAAAPTSPFGVPQSPVASQPSPPAADLPVNTPPRSDSLDALFGLGGPDDATDPLFAPAPAPNTAGNADPMQALLGAKPAAPPTQADHVSDLHTPWSSPALRAPTPPAEPQLPSSGPVLSWDQPPRDSTVVVTVPGARSPTPSPGASSPDAAPVATPPEPAAQVAAPTPSRPPASAPTSAPVAVAPTDEPELLAAFREGLGVPGLRMERLDAAQMRLIGELLRESTRGAVELLAARASLKREMRADVTVIATRENNPLKFSPTVEAALQHLFGPRMPGFLPPGPAMRDAFDDLRAHQLGLVAGMRAALEGVLKRFDPSVLESAIARRSSLMDSLMPSGRKAKLWELFQELYAQLSQEAADDFEELFGRAFLRAYQAHIDALEREEPGR